MFIERNFSNRPAPFRSRMSDISPHRGEVSGECYPPINITRLRRRLLCKAQSFALKPSGAAHRTMVTGLARFQAAALLLLKEVHQFGDCRLFNAEFLLAGMRIGSIHTRQPWRMSQRNSGLVPARTFSWGRCLRNTALVRVRANSGFNLRQTSL
jgi:hypothetical protein